MFRAAESFDQNLGGWNVSNVYDMDGMFEGSGMSPENLSKTLVGWAKQGGYQKSRLVWWKRFLNNLSKGGVHEYLFFTSTTTLRRSVPVGSLPCDWEELTPEGKEAAVYLRNNFGWRFSDL